MTECSSNPESLRRQAAAPSWREDVAPAVTIAASAPVALAMISPALSWSSVMMTYRPAASSMASITLGSGMDPPRWVAVLHALMTLLTLSSS